MAAMCTREGCKFPAKWQHEDRVFCGVHCGQKMRDAGATPLEKAKVALVPKQVVSKLPPKPAAAAKASPKRSSTASSSPRAPTKAALEKQEAELTEMKDLYGIVMARINSPEKLITLTPEEIEAIKSLSMLPDHIFRSVMTQAVDMSAAKTNIPRLASQIPIVLEHYNEAVAEEPARIPYAYIPRNLDPRVCARVDYERQDFLAEHGYASFYEDIDMQILNCNPVYLEMEGFKSVNEWAQDPKHIYMGPRAALTASGESGEYMWPSEASSWYVPLPHKMSCRALHNDVLVDKIMADIESGKETAEKYLALKGKVLGCVCLPYPCHCQAYVEVVRRLSSS